MPYSALTLRQPLQLVQGSTYKVSVQVLFRDRSPTQCYVNIFANGDYVFSKKSGEQGVKEYSNTFVAKTGDTAFSVGLLATANEQMTFELGYVKLELVP